MKKDFEIKEEFNTNTEDITGNMENYKDSKKFFKYFFENYEEIWNEVENVYFYIDDIEISTENLLFLLDL